MYTLPFLLIYLSLKWQMKSEKVAAAGAKTCICILVKYTTVPLSKMAIDFSFCAMSGENPLVYEAVAFVICTCSATKKVWVTAQLVLTLHR